MCYQNVSRLCCQSCWLFCSPVASLISLSLLPLHSSHLTEATAIIHRAASLHFQWLKVPRCLKMLNSCATVGNAITIPAIAGLFFPISLLPPPHLLDWDFQLIGARASFLKVWQVQFSQPSTGLLRCWLIALPGEFLMNTTTFLRLSLMLHICEQLKLIGHLKLSCF